MNIDNSSKASARPDASSHSFSDSMGEAAKSARETSQNDQAQQSNATAKREKDSLSSAKSHLKRSENTDDIANSTQQQPAEVDQTPRTLTLPTQLGLQAGSDDALPSEGQLSVDSVSATSGQETQSQGTPWVGLSGQAPWTPQDPSLTQGANSATSQPGEGAIAVGEPNGAAGATQPLPDQNTSLDGSATKTGDDDSQVRHAGTAETLQSPPVDTGNPAYDPTSLSQIANASTVAAATVDAAMPALSSSLNLGGISAIKANTAFKGLQNIGAGPKNTGGLTNNPVAGAKETDSYLSIQKEAKGQVTDSKDSVVSTAQHNTRGEATEQSLAAPVVANSQANTAIISNAHQQSFPAALGKPQESAPQNTPAATADTHLDTPVPASESSASAMASAVINSARLLQNIGQSEMRVGMRTAEFGDISIRTSSTRDTISAQISLGHDDLAKTLTAHMPEMQTRLASGEVMDVHIHNANQSGDFNGSFGSANQNGSNGQAEEDRTNHTNFLNTYSSSQLAVAAVPTSVIASAAASTGRLDIRA